MARAGEEPNVPPYWTTDCVGRMQLSLPSKADVAAMFPKELVRELDVNRQNWDYHARNGFPDGTPVYRSHSAYAGALLISLPMKDAERLKAMENAGTLKKHGWAYHKKLRRSFVALPLNEREGLAWRSDNYHAAILRVGDNLTYWSAVDRPGVDLSVERERNFQRLLSGLRARPPMTVPSESGVCLPYAFIRDDGGEVFRRIAMTYRLQQHPDVTIFLEDRTAEPIEPSTQRRPETYTPSYKLNEFWAPFGRDGGSYRSVWFPPGRNIKLAGYEGKAAFVEFTHPDGSVDYGYTVAVRGDPDSKEDKPDLFLYVLRHAALAKAKGIEPVSKEALLKMAETIAASVKRRSVVQ